MAQVVRLTITLHPEGLDEGGIVLPSRERIEELLAKNAQDGALDRAVEDLLGRFEIPALVYDATIEITE